MGLAHALEQLLAPAELEEERAPAPAPPEAGEPFSGGGGAVGDLPTGQLHREVEAEQRAAAQHAADVAREENTRAQEVAREERIRGEEREERRAEAAGTVEPAQPPPAAANPPQVAAPPRIVAEHAQPSSGQVAHTVAAKHVKRK